VKFNGGSELPSRKKKEDPWWFSPTIFDVVATDKAIHQSRLPPLIVQRVLYAMARAKYKTRPRRANRSWPETVLLDGATYQLSCEIDQNEKKIVVTYIKAPKEMRKPRRHK
jgi:hypothetical protein